MIEAKDLPKPVKTRETTADPKVLVRRMTLFNTRLRVVNRQDYSMEQRLILLIDQESVKSIKEAHLAAYTGINRCLFKILSNHTKNKGQIGRRSLRILGRLISLLNLQT